MNADQTRISFHGPREKRAPQPAIFMIAAIVCFGAIYFAPYKSLMLALLAGGVVLCIIAGVQAGQKLRLSAKAEAAEMSVRSLIEHEVDCAFLTDVDGNISYANAAAIARFDKAATDTLIAALSTILANPDAVLFRLLAHATEAGAAKEDIVTRNGRYRLSLLRVGDDSHLWRLDDLTSETPGTGRASDALSIPMLTAGPSGAILYLNEAFRKILGRRPKALSDVFTDLPVSSGQIHTIQTDTGLMSCMIAEVRGAAGRREIFALENDGNIPASPLSTNLGAGWDAIEDLPVPLLKLSADGEVLASNREARSLLGLRATDGKRVADMLDGLGRPIVDWLREAIEGRDGHLSEFLRGRGKNQDTFVQVTLNTAGGASDPHLIAVLNDVTELKTLEAQFVQSQKMQAIGQLAGGVAHDFNNLLTAISGHCDLLLLRHDQGDRDYGDLIQIHQNANRAASLVGQLLAFSRKQNLQPEVIDLRDTLSDLTHLLNRLVGEKVTLTLHHDQQLMPIKADKRQLEQVLMNLVVNARDAMPGGGEIRVVTENQTLESQLVRDRATVPPGDYVVVKVIDEGHGIAPEKMPKIFEPFYTTKRTGEGTGLGLSTAYGIVKQTGGFIFVDSEVNIGTEFTLLFPQHERQLSKPAPIVEATPVAIQVDVEGVVLLVEDEAPVRAFASRALRLRGYTVLEADCAEAALTLLDDPDLNVDIFVTDVIMPGMDGPTWVREALERRPDTRVVFVSGYAEDAFGDEQSRIPNSVFLPKPFSLSDLTNTVQSQLY